MANRLYTQFPKSLQKGIVEVFGSFTTNSSGVIVSQNGIDVTATKSGTGKYTLTLNDPFMSLLYPDIAIQAGTPQNLVPQVLSADVVSAQTVVFQNLSGATPTEATSAITVYYRLTCKNSTV